MGDYFVMSTRFNKSNASDFGFISKSENLAINPKDNSTWIKVVLYDFGWGKENGFYKFPLPNFDVLFELVLYSENRDDKYGAAAIILEKFPEELLYQCERLAKDPYRKKEFKELVELFKLNISTNRCSVAQKTNEQIQNDYMRWKRISEIAKKT